MNYVVFDVGGTEIKYSVMGQDGTIFTQGIVPTPKTGLEEFLNTLQELYRANCAGTAGIAVSMPGIIDSAAGVCRSGGALGYNQGQPIAALLAERCHCPVHIENDGKCAVLAEYATGSLQGCQNAAVYLLGTGVGGGLIIGGEPVRGRHFSAGEFSFLSTDAAAWGQMGAMVGVNSSTLALVRAVQAAVGVPAEQPFNGRDAFGYLNAGHEGALAALRRFCRGIAWQIYNLQVLLDLERVAIGGGVSRQPLLVKTIDECFGELLADAPEFVRRDISQTVEIVPCRYGNEANQIGALQSYLKAEGE